MAVLAGCTSGQTTTPTVTSVNPIATSRLQLAVGTANVNGNKGLNVVTTLRQTNGTSVLFNTPTLTGPFAFTVAGANVSTTSGSVNGSTISKAAPSTAEVAAGSIGGTNPALTNPPNQAGAPVPAAAQTTFGIFGGVAATGFALSNSNVNSVISTACAVTCAPDLAGYPAGNGPVTVSVTTVTPYAQPFYASDAASKAALFTPWLGAPAFAGPAGLGTRDGTYASGLFGAAMGLSVFNGVVPGSGTYTLNTVIPTGFAGNTPQSGTLTATASLPNPTNYINGGAAIAVPTVTFTGNGGATGTYPLPAGATGAWIQIVDLGSDGGNAPNCYPGTVGNYAGNFGPPAFYTVAVGASGAWTLPANLGPRPSNQAAAVPSICTAAQNTAALKAATAGDTIQVSAIAFDYNLASLVPALSAGAQAPAIPAQADIALSATGSLVSP